MYKYISNYNNSNQIFITQNEVVNLLEGSTPNLGGFTVQNSVNLNSCSIGNLIFNNDIISSSTDTLNLNVQILNLEGIINLGVNNISNDNTNINSHNLLIRDPLIQIGTINDNVDKGFVFTWTDINNNIYNGFIGFDSKSSTFKLVNELNVDLNNNTIYRPINEKSLGTLEINQLNVLNINPINGNLNLTSLSSNLNLQVNSINYFTFNSNFINVNNNYITNCPLPINNSDVSNKLYVDNHFLNSKSGNFTKITTNNYGIVIDGITQIDINNDTISQLLTTRLSSIPYNNHKYLDGNGNWSYLNITDNLVNSQNGMWKIFNNINDVNNMVISVDTINNNVSINKGYPYVSSIILEDNDVLFSFSNNIISASIDNNG
jgi:hypothetical protein